MCRRNGSLSAAVPATIGVVGLGYWGPNLLRNFAATPGWTVKYACDLAEAQLDRTRRQFPSVTFTTDLAQVLDDPSVDAVAIATPASTHAAIACAALERGKHVLVEKPLATTSADADAMIAAADAANRHLIVDHTFVYTSAVGMIRDLVARGDLGDLYYFDSTRINLGLIQPDANVLWDLAIHDLSILGEIHDLATLRSVYAHGSRHYGPQAEIAHLHLSFDEGFEAHIHVSWLSPVKLRQTIIGGTRRMVVFDDLQPSEKIRVYDSGVQNGRALGSAPMVDPFFPVYRTGDVLIPKLDGREALRVQAEHFLAVLEGREAPRVPASRGRTILRILELADQSLAARQPVSC